MPLHAGPSAALRCMGKAAAWPPGGRIPAQPSQEADPVAAPTTIPQPVPGVCC